MIVLYKFRPFPAWFRYTITMASCSEAKGLFDFPKFFRSFQLHYISYLSYINKMIREACTKKVAISNLDFNATY